ncbi:hypothetical protein FHR84_000553 [Actinopolyspora biskrensis]|uniref:Uncharacterized protein n=1 Tax=Actinopolyspora biskrensis TaxID=1470178 RepID=A0A852YUJ5_9ACTN|nr:hypothetical protein [Actinopolyspora biskrensis]NYH77239.1 hypothetical protein [Actinopolyspora biskrensis]
MTNVLIQPCASTAARRNWQETVDQLVAFSEAPHVSALTTSELDRLTELHGRGAAMFWGRTSFHDKSMSSVRTGDVVLFTRENHIRKVGTVGASFRNQAFGDLLWRKPDDAESFPNVFSLLDVADVELHYSVLWNVPGISHGDIFRQGRVITDLRLADDLLEAIGVQTAEGEAFAKNLKEAVDTSLKSNVELRLEQVLKERTEYQAPARAVHVDRTEARLVQEYDEALPHTEFVRVSSSAGITDLQTSGREEAELIEAKGDNTRRRVREAVAQLLQYAPENEEDLDRLTALFPAPPNGDDIRYLHRLGIDCVYRAGPQLFERKPAPDSHRQYMRRIWNDKVEVQPAD